MGISRTLRVISGATLTGALVLTSAPSATADQVRDAQWPLKSLKAESVWETTKGKGQTVAVIDDGVNANHPDLRGNVLKGKDFIDGGSTAPAEGDSHGTGMAGLIAGHGHGPDNAEGVMGLAPESKILPIREDAEAQGGFRRSIRYAVDHGATVINISMAGGKATDSEAEKDAIAYALKRDVLVIAGTGNTGTPIEYPAAYPGAVAVGGVGQDGQIWENSNYGSATLLTGPATKIPSSSGKSNPNGYGIGDGTSNATAYVSATAALVRAKYPDLSAGQVANRLTETAQLPDSMQGVKLPDEKYGYGSIRPLAALTEDVPKGDKWGPLSVPQSIKNEEAVAEQEEEDQALREKENQEAVIFQNIAGVVGLVFVSAVVLVIVLVVRSRRKKRRNDFDEPGYPGGGYPYPPGQAPGYGMPPHQQQPMPPQPTAPPQQPPRN